VAARLSCLIAAGALAAACGSAPTENGSASAADPSAPGTGTEVGGDAGGNGARTGTGADGGDGGTVAHDGGQGDGGGPSSFGTSMGDDPCVVSGTAAAWVSPGRCAARTGRTTIVSSQSGTLARMKTIPVTQANLTPEGETTYGTDGSMYVNTGYLSALDPSTLAVKWTGTSDNYAPVVGPDGTLYISSEGIGGILKAVDGTTRAVKWSRKWTTSYVRPVTVLGDGNLALLDLVENVPTLEVLDHLTGATSWSVSMPASGLMGASMVASPSTGAIYVATTFGGLYGISSTTKAIAWNLTSWKPLQIALDERAQRLYVVAAGAGPRNLKVGTVAVDGTGATFGAEFFPTTGFNQTLSSLALGAGGWVYFAVDGTLFGYDTTTATKWEATTGASLAAPVVGGDGTVYLGADKADGVYAMAFTRSGALRWNTLLSTTITSPTHVGATASIAPSGHLVLLFPANRSVFLLGP
jgi:hypothetical protein